MEEPMYPGTVFEKADRLTARGVFLGGPREKFVTAGRGQLEILLSRGLLPDHRVLDVGCGALRGGWWLINFLRPGRYFGIEPNEEMLAAGIEVMLGDELLAEKKPRFAGNADFDFSVFDDTFEFVIARSVWTHASLAQIGTMLDSFLTCSASNAEFVASIVPPTGMFGREYGGALWVGRSHESDGPGFAHYRFRTVRKLRQERGLVAEDIGSYDDQRWVVVARQEAVSNGAVAPSDS
jgi:SAM-dependent methyltransferase